MNPTSEFPLNLISIVIIIYENVEKIGYCWQGWYKNTLKLETLLLLDQFLQRVITRHALKKFVHLWTSFCPFNVPLSPLKASDTNHFYCIMLRYISSKPHGPAQHISGELSKTNISKYTVTNVLCESISCGVIRMMLMMGTMSVGKHYLSLHINIFDIFWITSTGDYGEMYTMPSCSLSLLSMLLASMCLWPTRLVQVSKGAGRALLHQTSHP